MYIMASEDDTIEITRQIKYVDQRIAFLVVGMSIVFFWISNSVIASIIKPPSSASKDPWRWKNLFVSWIHAILSGCCDITCFALYPEMFDDLAAHINDFTFATISFSTGYFIYDSLDMFINNRLLSDWGVTLHHIIVLIVLAYNIQTKYAIGITCVALLAEVNGIFLHARKLMQIFQFSFGHKIYILNKYINLITFVIFRGGPLGRIFYAYLYECPALAPPSRVVFVCLAVAMTVINMCLFWRLCKNDILTQKLKSEK